MASCSSKDHVSKNDKEDLYVCVKLDKQPQKQRIYCAKCFYLECHNFDYTNKCALCHRFFNEKCFEDVSNGDNFCYDCMGITPNEIWKVQESMVEQIKEWFGDDNEQSEFKVKDVINILDEESDCNYFVPWRDMIQTRIKEIKDKKKEEELKQKIKEDHEKYTKITRLGDNMKRFIPELEETEAHMAAKRIDLKQVDINDLNFDNAESFIHWLIEIKPQISL